MQKTKLGVSVAVLGAAMYLLGLVGGYIPTLLTIKALTQGTVAVPVVDELVDKAVA